VDGLKKSCPAFALMRSLAMQFRGILRSGTAEGLMEWMAKAKNCGIYSLKRFAKTLRRDWNAVKNSLKESFNNGPVEGHINRLKTLKREMYGRAGFELLPGSSAPLCCSLAHSSCTKPESEPDLRKVTPSEGSAGKVQGCYCIGGIGVGLATPQTQNPPLTPLELREQDGIGTDQISGNPRAVIHALQTNDFGRWPIALGELEKIEIAGENGESVLLGIAPDRLVWRFPGQAGVPGVQGVRKQIREQFDQLRRKIEVEKELQRASGWRSSCAA
jgi:hypothetical protein